MALSGRVSRRLRGGVLSAALHVVLALVILAGGRPEGLLPGNRPGPVSMPLQLGAPKADKKLPSQASAPIPTLASEDELHEAIVRLAPPPADETFPHPAEFAPPGEPPTRIVEPVSISDGEVPAAHSMSDDEKAALSWHLERLAEESANASRTEATWRLGGREYSAVLSRERANEGTALEHVVAQVSTSGSDKVLTTTVILRRLAFSQFTQMVDRWDPMVQLHDDEIVGRFHSNSQLKLLYDSRAAPTFLGKVTTAARSFDTEARARKRKADVFRGGVETRAGRIELPESLQPFEWAPRDGKDRVHEFTSDAHIRFFADGSYTWRTREAGMPEYLNEPSGHPVYFLAAPDVTLYVQGVVAGKVLVYSPQRIVIEGSLTYASDPRRQPDSDDYLGLVSDRYVEVAPPAVTGPGDLEIDAAIIAGRRFRVTRIDHRRSATLRIFGSLSARSLSATEPRYATHIEYDFRFERQRPPGFPSTNRYEAADWDAKWTEMPGQKPGGPS